MTFEDIIAALSKEMGAEIEVEGGFCAMRAGAGDQGVRWRRQEKNQTLNWVADKITLV